MELGMLSVGLIQAEVAVMAAAGLHVAAGRIGRLPQQRVCAQLRLLLC